MNRMQWTLGGLLLAMLAVSAGLAAVAANSGIVAQLVVAVDLGLLGLAATGAVCTKGSTRTFWVGCLVFTAGYGSAVIVARDALVTDAALQYLPALYRGPQLGDKVMAQWSDGRYYPATVVEIDGGQYRVQWDDGSTPLWVARAQLTPTTAAQHDTAHAVLAPLIGLLAGFICRWLFGGPDPPAARDASTPSSSS